MTVRIEGPMYDAAPSCEPVLQALPDWFGVDTAVQAYGQTIDGLPTFVARHEGQVAGFVTLKQHNPHTAELYVMGVRCELHRRGIGRLLVSAAEDWLGAAGVEYAYIKTLGPSGGSRPYDLTRRFYLACGYRPLEEFKSMWGSDPCLIMVKKLG